MISYEEYLDELIPVNLNTPMRREDYYKKYIPNFSIKESYDQYVRMEKQDERDRL